MRWTGGTALFAIAAYLVTPLSAAGAEGAPVAFAINIRFAIPALLLGAALLPLGPGIRWRRSQWLLLGALLAVMVISDRSDAVLRDPERLFGLGIALVAVALPAALLYARSRGVPSGPLIAAGAALALVVVGVGYPAQRDYLRNRFHDFDPSINLDTAYRWLNRQSDVRIGLVGMIRRPSSTPSSPRSRPPELVVILGQPAGRAFNATPLLRLTPLCDLGLDQPGSLCPPTLQPPPEWARRSPQAAWAAPPRPCGDRRVNRAWPLMALAGPGGLDPGEPPGRPSPTGRCDSTPRPTRDLAGPPRSRWLSRAQAPGRRSDWATRPTVGEARASVGPARRPPLVWRGCAQRRCLATREQERGGEKLFH